MVAASPYQCSMHVLFGSRSFSRSSCLQRCLSSSAKINHVHYSVNRNGFGIVAAMTKNQVIGVNGSLPWKNLTQDKNHFINLTRNKVLIVGRKTFALEDPSLSHIRHARACIVVSRTMNQEDLISLRNANNSTNIETKVLLTRSFDEAVELANAEKHKRMIKSETDEHNVVNETLDCWVAGGEAIYRDALHHSDAVEVQLTHVDMMIDTNQFREVAYFPVEDMNSDAWESSSCRDGELCEFKVWRKKLPPDFADTESGG